MKNNMNNINFTNKINLPIVGEIDLYGIKSISVLSDTDTYYIHNLVGRTVSYNHRVIIKNDYFEFEILYYENRDDKEILYLFDIFKQLSDLEEEYQNYEWQQSLIKKRYLGTLYTSDSEYIMLNDKKTKVRSDMGIILKHLQDEFYTESDIEFNTEFSSKKFTIGLQKMIFK